MNRHITRRHAMGLVAAVPALLTGRSYASAGGIDESGFVPIGGIEQWIAVQGRHIEDPVIVYLHGGPAEAQSPLLQEFRPWERAFTVLNWDQRGSGRTYGRYGAATPGMSTPQGAFDRLTQDAIEVAEYACQHLGKRKVILVGQSWGSVLGLRVVKRRPDLFSAYVGTGFVASWAQCTKAREAWARAQAETAHDEATIKALDSTSALPTSDMRRMMAGREYLMSQSDVEYLQLQQKLLGRQTKDELHDWVAGGQFTIPRLLRIIGSWDPRKVGLEFKLPIYVIQGRDDHVTSFEGAKSYIAEISAPRKAFIPVDGGHFACFTDPTAFVGALRKFVRPVAMA
jgi:pimeloyl-ACP methyl ester carboxylesterase